MGRRVLILLAVALSSRTAAWADTEPSLIVHEWGTFTSFAGPTGRSLPWSLLIQPTPLSDFVHVGRQEGRTVLLEVRDNGPGVVTDVLSKLFQPFSISASEAAKTAAGVGLGLALCRRYAGTMGGDVYHQPSDQGRCFVLTMLLVASRLN